MYASYIVNNKCAILLARSEPNPSCCGDYANPEELNGLSYIENTVPEVRRYNDEVTGTQFEVTHILH
jgi:hypothetical protein